MKLLHSKTVAEPIRLVSACPCMNLFAVVAESSITVYRSTTLTAVASAALPKSDCGKTEAQHTHGNGEGNGFCAAWSPSGRLFTLALPTGVVLLLDVENGVVARLLVPRKPQQYLSRHFNEEEERNEGVHSPVGDASPAVERIVRAVDDGDAEAEEEEGEESDRQRSVCSAALREPHVLPLSTCAGPVATLSWAALPVHTDALCCRRDCLPLPRTVSTPLLEESGSLAQVLDSDAQSSMGCLFVLDREGGLSVCPLGLQEVYFGRISDTARAETGAGSLFSRADSFCVVPDHSTSSSSGSDTLLASLRTGTLSVQQLLAAVSTQRTTEQQRPVAALAAFVGYLTARSAAVRDGAGGVPRVVQVDLSPLLARLVDARVSLLCRLAEYCRTAQRCFQAAETQWHALARERVLADLRLPAHGQTLRDSIVESVALPNEVMVSDYYDSLEQEDLADDLQRLTTTVSTLSRSINGVCCRAFDAALSLTVWLRDACSVGWPSSSELSDVGPHVVALYNELCRLLAECRRRCEHFNTAVRQESALLSDLLVFAIQRASLLAVAEADNASATRGDGSNVPFTHGTEPLPVTRQPALLRTVERIHHGQPLVDVLPCGSDAQTPTSQVLSLLCDRIHAALQSAMNSATLASCLTSVSRPMVAAHADGASVLYDVEVPPTQASSGEGSDAGVRLHAVDRAADSLSVTLLPPALLEHCAGASSATCAPVLSGDVGCPVLLQEAPSVIAALSREARAAWYGYLSEDKHVLLFCESSNDGAQTSAAGDGFTIVIVDDTGSVRSRVADEDDDDDDDDAENGGQPEAEEDGGGGESASGSARSADFAVSQVRGIKVDAGSLLASMSRAREFLVVASESRLVVVDLYEE